MSESKAEQAKILFKKNANCAQSVLAVFHDECGINYDTALKLASGFGGGMGRMREVCGAVSALFMIASLKYGYNDLNNKDLKDKHYALIQKLANQFKDECGSIVCRELLQLQSNHDLSPISTARSPTFYKKRPCSEIVALAATLAENLLKTSKEN